MYPNPTSDFLQIESDNVVIAALIMDAVGRELRLEMEPVGEGRYRINVSAIPTGLYILKTVTKVKIDLQKIIIRK
ncbi:MAG: T9SS type A sorting domain-containing protein [Bacteroidota bacterium]